MIEAEYYRSEAERCRAIAAKSHDSESMARWIRLAIEYEQLAANLASDAQVIRFPDDRRG